MTCFFANSRRHFAPRLAPMPRISRAGAKINYNHPMQNMPYAVGQLLVERTRSDCPACGFAHVLSAPAAFSLLLNAWRLRTARADVRGKGACAGALGICVKRTEKICRASRNNNVRRAHEHVCARVRARRALGLDRAENLKKRVKIR